MKHNLFRRITPALAVALVAALVIIEANCSPIFATSASESATRLTADLCKNPLQSGIYYVDSDLTIDNHKTGFWYKSLAGITIAEDADVTIYVESGCTLTCYGSDAYESSINTVVFSVDYFDVEQQPARAGISVPTGSSLTLCGEGNVIAKGGNGFAEYAGSNGGDGGFEGIKIIWCDPIANSIKGNGGFGGMGALAPAAGIGGDASTAGIGAHPVGGWKHGGDVAEEGTVVSGENGKDGGDGDAGEGMGTLYVVDSVNVTATAGDTVSGETEGCSGGQNFTKDFEGMKILSAGGGGGGNGGSSGNAADIGGAGGSGGGGGGGGEGYGCSTGKAGMTTTEPESGETATTHSGGKGGDSGVFQMSDGETTYQSKGGEGGEGGAGGTGGTLYITSTATVNGTTGADCADSISGDSTTTGGNGQKTTVKACEKVSVNVTLDGEETDWTKDRDIAIYQNEQRAKTLTNVVLPALTETASYYTWIPVGQSYTLYADEVCIGDTITSDTSDTDLKAFEATATVQKDDVNWSGKRVDLYQNKLEYTLEDSDNDGVYTREIYETHTDESGENEYRVYIDDVATDQNLTMTSKSASKDTYSYYTTSVSVENDGNPMTGQVVALAQDGDIVYNLTESETAGTYTKVVYKNKTDNKYDVLVNAQETGSVIKANSLSNLSATIQYYTASITLKKDGAAWSDASMALMDEDGNLTFLTGSNGIYSTMLAESQGDMEVYVYGSAGNSDTGGVINSTNKTYSAEYYTISLDKNVSGSNIYSSEIVRSGDKISEPNIPYANGQTFDRWCSDAAGTTAFDFTQPITGQTTIYASWQTPGVSIGTLVRCNADGTVNGGGEYYKMGNLNISGFPSDGNKITMVVLDYTNATFSNLTTIFPSSMASITKSDTKIVITFKSDQNVRNVEKQLRQLIVKPSYDVNSTIQATVYGYTN